MVKKETLASLVQLVRLDYVVFKDVPELKATMVYMVILEKEVVWDQLDIEDALDQLDQMVQQDHLVDAANMDLWVSKVARVLEV